MNILTKITANGIDFKVGNPTLVTWDSTKNMNDFKTQGVYEIYGERTVKTDNLPITNEGEGHSIAARLTVVASTLQPANNEICVTQFLQLSNRIGGEGSTYIRTYNENNNSMNGWSPWQKQIGMVETYMSSDTLTIDVDNMPIGDGLNGMIDNCMYSGIYSDCVIDYTGTGGSFDTSSATFLETFILVVINDYDAMGKLGMPGHITQLKYAVDAITGQSTVKKRVGTGNDINTISWGDWTEIGGGSDITAEETDSVVSNIEESVVSSALRKTPQVLTENEKLQARENIDAQKELTLTIKDNGNIVIGNIQGENKEFMPATPSGDPLHYAYIAAGADYNNSGADITKTAPWGETVTHKTGHYYLNGLGDITEEQMMEIYNEGITLPLENHMLRKSARCNMYLQGMTTSIALIGYYYAYQCKCEVINIGEKNELKSPTNPIYYSRNFKLNGSQSTYLFSSCPNLKHIIGGYLRVDPGVFDISMFQNTPNLETVYIKALKSDMFFNDCGNISKDSIKYMIDNATPTTAITIILHHNAYERLSKDTEIINALDSKNNSLTNGSISLVCAVHSEEIIPNN